MTNPTCNIREAAAILKVHPKTMEDLVKEGSLPAGKVGRAWVLMTRDVVAYAERAIMAQTAELLRQKDAASPKRGRKVRAAQVRVAH